VNLNSKINLDHENPKDSTNFVQDFGEMVDCWFCGGGSMERLL
jgi:hypothetical protein